MAAELKARTKIRWWIFLEKNALLRLFASTHIEGIKHAVVRQQFRARKKSYTLNYRPGSKGDIGVIDQIFFHEEYRFSHWPQGKAFGNYYNNCCDAGRHPLIIDVGANIGAASCYFAEIFPNSHILAVEPAPENCALLRKNLPQKNILIIEGAIGALDGTVSLIDPGLSDWGFRVGAGDCGNDVVVYSPTTLLETVADRHLVPLIFKADIEGGEKDLFSSDYSWINEFALVILETHDWMFPGEQISGSLFSAVAQFNFDVVFKGENIFFFNNSILYPKLQ